MSMLQLLSREVKSVTFNEFKDPAFSIACGAWWETSRGEQWVILAFEQGTSELMVGVYSRSAGWSGWRYPYKSFARKCAVKFHEWGMDIKYSGGRSHYNGYVLWNQAGCRTLWTGMTALTDGLEA